MKITCKKIGINGEGIGYEKRIPVFCDGLLPSEVAEVKIKEDKKKYKVATLTKRLNTSKNRVKPKCPHQAKCGACPLMIANNSLQYETKTSLLKEALWKYAHINGSIVRKLHTNKNHFYYRNQCKIPIKEINNQLIGGMYQTNSNHFIPVDTCYVHDKELENIKQSVLKLLNDFHLSAYSPKTKTGIRYLVIRVLQNQSQLTIVTGNDTLPKQLIKLLEEDTNITSLFQCINTKKETIDILSGKMIHHFGPEEITLTIHDIDLSLSPRSFFQLNYSQALNLYDMVVSKIDPSDTLVECYAGIGALSFLAKDKAKHIIGIENIKDAVDNANATAKRNHFNHIEFLCMDAASGLYKAAIRHPIDTLLVDPPRSGLDENMLEAILSVKPKEIIYVSCNPSTLAKNLNVLKESYKIHTIIPYDLFPQTPLVEAIVKLSLKI